MNKVKIGSIFLSEDSIRDQQGKNIVLGPLPEIVFKVVPNNFTFCINFSLLYIKPETPYNLRISMIQSDGKKIIESKIEGLSVQASGVPVYASSFVSMTVKNQEFSCFGDSKVEIYIEEHNNTDNHDTMSLVVPILERR